jgi:carbon-monoxide dehydrogenase iron sulfur subunit
MSRNNGQDPVERRTGPILWDVKSPPSGPKYLNPDHASCTGCRLCEYFCVIQHYGAVINPELSRVRVYHVYPGPMAIPIQCSNCADYPCVAACPLEPKVLSVDKTKFVLTVDRDRCLGHRCGKCADACTQLRSGAIHFYPPTHDYPIVCDQCDGAGPDGDPDPQCAKHCPFSVFFYSTPKGGEGWRYAWSPERIAKDLAERFQSASPEKLAKSPYDIPWKRGREVSKQ